MDPIALQKQVRDNSEDLTRYLGDLKNWQDEIKKKEQGLNSGGKDTKKSIPPVRSKKNKGKSAKVEVTPSTSSTTTPIEEKKPHSNGQSPVSDFINYDFEKATNAYQQERQGIPLSETIKEADKQKRIEEANYEKENGNINVKNKKWKEAIECYSRAISHDDTNPIFFANRALCFIKFGSFFEAIADCSKAINLDSNYVKAYLRRGLAYTSLEEPEAAIEDLTKAVQMEPTNKEAKKCLADAKALLKKLESADNSTIIAISKSLNERSKIPLKRIGIEEIGNPSEVCLEKKVKDTSEAIQRPASLDLKHSCPSNSSSKTATPKTSTPRTPITPLDLTPVYLSEIPEAPKNSVQFTLTWNQIKPEDRYKYLSQIPGSQLPQVFGDSLESDIFSDVLKSLKSAEVDDPIVEYLLGLSETKRFMALSLFMNNDDKSIVEELLKRSLEQNHITDTEMSNLKKMYGI